MSNFNPRAWINRNVDDHYPLSSPADQGIAAARAQAQAAEFIGVLIDDFKKYALEMMAEGMDEGFDDHMDFLRACLDNFSEKEG